MLAAAALTAAASAQAGPWIDSGDLGLRHDLQLLVDAGHLRTLTTTWPLPWSDVLGRLRGLDVSRLSASEYAAYERLRRRMREQTRVGPLQGWVGLAAADASNPLRGFEAAPREQGEISAGLEWTGRRFAYRIQATAVDDPQDDETLRLDGSYAGLALGNWMLSINALDRWWGPGWDGSLILSNNARPVPALTIERNGSAAFKTPWLSWLGPWRLVVFNGLMEGDRGDHARPMLFGARFTFSPLPGLELGLSRTAMWGGEGRPEDARAFWNMLVGRDNRGRDLAVEEEPGNQLAGFDARWASPIGRAPYALYLQGIGEDEANHLPSRYMWLGGMETWGALPGGAGWRLHVEYAHTRAGDIDNYAYNHAIYTDGYRYYGRPIGHAADNDSRQRTLGLLVADAAGGCWSLLLRDALINTDGGGLNAVAPTRLEIRGLQAAYRRDVSFGRLSLGLARQRVEDRAAGKRRDDTQAYLQWQVAF